MASPSPRHPPTATAKQQGSRARCIGWLKISLAAESGVYWTEDNPIAFFVLPGLADTYPLSLAIDSAGDLLVGTRGYGLHRAPPP